MFAINPRPRYINGTTLTNLTEPDLGGEIKYYHFSNGSFKISQLPIEKCTSEHFSRAANSKIELENLGINSFYCLPINNTFELGGDLLYGNQSFI